MDIDIPLSDLIREANFKVGYYLRAAKADTRLLDCAQDMLREAESRAGVLGEEIASLAVLREADQATIASLGLVNKSLADALIGEDAEEPLLYAVEWVDLLAKEYEGEHDFGEDADPGSTREMLSRVRRFVQAARTALRSAGRLQPPQG